VGKLKEGNHLGDSGLDAITSLSQREIGWEGMDWTNLSLDRRKRRVILNKIMNVRVALDEDTHLQDEEPLASQEDNCSLKFVKIRFVQCAFEYICVQMCADVCG
jgi:hypothetical protein